MSCSSSTDNDQNMGARATVVLVRNSLREGERERKLWQRKMDCIRFPCHKPGLTQNIRASRIGRQEESTPNKRPLKYIIFSTNAFNESSSVSVFVLFQGHGAGECATLKYRWINIKSTTVLVLDIFEIIRKQ